MFSKILKRQLMNLISYNQSAKLVLEDATKQLINLNRQLAKFTRSHSHKDCIFLFQKIHSSGRLKPDQYSLSTTLTSCANLPNLSFGNQLHAHAIYTGLKAYPHVSNTLLSLYAKSENLGFVRKIFCEMGYPDVYSWTTLLSACTKLGQVYYACKLLDEMPLRNVAPWNAVITGCFENGFQDVGFDLFRRMHVLGVKHDKFTFASVLSSCSIGLYGLGKQVHSMIVKSGFLGRSSVTNSLLSMYFECGNAGDAYRVYDEGDDMVHNEITYNAMINGLVSLERGEEALMMFKEMLEACLIPTELTFVSLMSSGSAVAVCFHLHAQAIKMGYEPCTAVSNAAMAMYADHGLLNAVRKLFDKLEEKDIVTWNTMIAAYAQNNCTGLAFSAYIDMQRTGVMPGDYTVGTLLASSESLEVVEMFYALVLKNGLSLISEVVMNALISAFSKQGGINQAYQLFCGMHSKNLITWNAMISGSLLNQCPTQALELFLWMQKLQIRPNLYTLTIILSTCASVSALRHGREVHGYILRHYLFKETSLGNGLITMYAKCGVLDGSARVFHDMSKRDVVSWNAIISAFAQYGEGNRAVQYFSAMQLEVGMRPDQATFTAVLSACSHTGLVSDGIHIFNSMVNDYGVQPGLDHFSCLVDLLGRAGYLDETEGLIESKDLKVDPYIRWTLFSACAAYGNVRLGRIVAGLLLQTEKNDPAVYVLLSNIHADAGQWEDAATVRDMMTRVGVVKQPGCSWVKP